MQSDTDETLECKRMESHDHDLQCGCYQSRRCQCDELRLHLHTARTNRVRPRQDHDARCRARADGSDDRALVATGKTLGASQLLERVTAAMGPHCAGVFAGVGQHVPAGSVRALVAEAERVGADALVASWRRQP